MIECQIGGRVLDQHRAAQQVLHARDVVRHDGEGFLGEGYRQQVVVVGAAVAAPGEMLRHEDGSDGAPKGGHPRKVLRSRPTGEPGRRGPPWPAIWMSTGTYPRRRSSRAP